MTVLQIRLSENLYVKDPQSTDLGMKIIERSTIMIDELGFEAFTFKKLSAAIESTEASIYRYFENKHRLLVYLITWYWAWIDYRLEFETHHLADPRDKLDVALRIITEKKVNDPAFPEINEVALYQIVIAESDKTYLTKQVDEDNKEGLFRGYKSVCKHIAAIVKAISPTFDYPHALISMALEAAHQQIFFAQHLPALTELSKMDDPYQENFNFLRQIILRAIDNQ